MDILVSRYGEVRSFLSSDYSFKQRYSCSEWWKDMAKMGSQQIGLVLIIIYCLK